MWQRNNFVGNQDSDQSISEEEELASDWPENCISLGAPAEKKADIHIQSQLQILRDTCDHRKTGLTVHEEVELPIFHNECDFICSPRNAATCNSEDEIISDEEVHSKVKENNVLSTLRVISGARDIHKIGPHSFGKENQNGASTWSSVTKEADTLVHLNENAGCSSSNAVSFKANRSCKGNRGKAKPKFSFRFQTHREDFFWPLDSKDGDELPHNFFSQSEERETVDRKTSMAALLERFHGKQIEKSDTFGVPAKVTVDRNCVEYSMAGPLDGCQGNNGLLQGSSKMYSKTERQRVQLVIDDGEPPVAPDSGQSSEDEADVQNLKLILPESKGKSMADQFHEALGAASVNERSLFALPRQSGGLFGKLQLVMQDEKQREMNFLKRLRMGSISHDEASWIDVKILSRCLEARMTVCCCSFIIDKKKSHLAGSSIMMKENGEGTVAVIFSPRTCGDVELEVGNLVRIHQPWKEIHGLGGNETIILSTFFSQMST